MSETPRHHPGGGRDRPDLRQAQAEEKDWEGGGSWAAVLGETQSMKAVTLPDEKYDWITRKILHAGFQSQYKQVLLVPILWFLENLS